MSFVVFLDVDGVLNTRTTCERAPSELYMGIDELRIQILAGTIRECRATCISDSRRFAKRKRRCRPRY